MRPFRALLVMGLLLTVCFTLATYLVPRSNYWTQSAEGSFLSVALGDARRMFANHFFTKADVYFHSGYYPSIFDQAKATDKHMTEIGGQGAADHDEDEHASASDFLGQPKDWIDKFSRHFYPSTHSHLDKAGEAKEILPWLRLSAELDPHHVEAYTVGAYWLRDNMRKPKEAEAFLRQGLAENPDSFEILFELGKIYAENFHDTNHAQNIWELALNRWQKQETAGKKPEPIICNEIVANLAHLEEERGNLQKSMDYLEMENALSPFPDVVKKRIEELKEKMAASAPK